MDRHVINTHRQNHNHHKAFDSRVPFFCVCLSGRTSAGGHHDGCLRRAERRLRSWWRHERMSVAAALAEAHHSAPKVGAEPYNAPRSQKTASAGTRPGVLKDPEPQVRAATVGYVAAGAPLLSVVLVSDMMQDDATVQFLLQQSLLARAVEGGAGQEEEERGGGGEEGEEGEGVREAVSGTAQGQGSA